MLAGCGPNKQGAASNQAAPPAATAQTVTPTTKGAPRRRDGYWELSSIDESGAEMEKQFLCVGGSSEDFFSVFDQLEVTGGCTKTDFSRTLTGWNFDVQCGRTDDQSLVTEKGSISGDFLDAFRIDQTVRASNGSAMKGSVVGHRLGDCPATLKAGDLADNKGSVIGNMGH